MNGQDKKEKGIRHLVITRSEVRTAEMRENAKKKTKADAVRDSRKAAERKKTIHVYMCIRYLHRIHVLQNKHDQPKLSVKTDHTC